MQEVADITGTASCASRWGVFAPYRRGLTLPAGPWLETSGEGANRRTRRVSMAKLRSPLVAK